MGVVRRGEVYWVNLDPVVGTEIRRRVPYDSPQWRELAGALKRFPVVVVVLARKPHRTGAATDRSDRSRRPP